MKKLFTAIAAIASALASPFTKNEASVEAFGGEKKQSRKDARRNMKQSSNSFKGLRVAKFYPYPYYTVPPGYVVNSKGTL